MNTITIKRQGHQLTIQYSTKWKTGTKTYAHANKRAILKEFKAIKKLVFYLGFIQVTALVDGKEQELCLETTTNMLHFINQVIRGFKK